MIASSVNQGKISRKASLFRYAFLVLSMLLSLLLTQTAFAETSSKPATSGKAVSGGATPDGTVSGGSGTVTPDLFTGTMSTGIPIEVPAGRKGMQPGLALTYRSTNGNGWVGVGWDIDTGAIERSARNGIDYSGNDYILRLNGSAIDLVNFPVNGDEYRANIEGSFFKVRKLTAADEKPYWVVRGRRKGTLMLTLQND